MPVITARGNNCILVITDLLTKWVEVYALPDETAETVSNCVVDFISRHGCPERIITDQGPNFESNLFKKLCQDFNILKNHTTEYHPAANGQTERVNRCLNDMLAIFEEKSSENWDLLLPQIIFAYRTSVHSSTGMSPFQALYHRQPILPGRLVLGTSAFPALTNAFSNPDVLKLWEKLRENNVKAKEAQKIQFDKKAGNISFKPGDHVLFRNFVRNKLQRRFRGPFLVVRQGPTPNTYCLRSNEGNIIVANSENLKTLFDSKVPQLPNYMVDSSVSIVPDSIHSIQKQAPSTGDQNQQVAMDHSYQRTEQEEETSD